MSDEQAQTTSEAGAPQEVDRIRDIIFGPQMRDYEIKFRNLERDLDRLQKELNRMAEQLGEQESNQGKKLQALRKELRQANDDLRDEMRQTTQQLASDTLDRAALGELLIEAGTRLKTGDKLADLLIGISEDHLG